MALSKHAEENAVDKYLSTIGIKGRKKIASRKLHIIVVRINSLGELTESKPCSHCVSVMRDRGIRKVTYSNKHGELITESVKSMDTSTHSSVGYRSIEDAIHILDTIINSS